MTWNDDVTTTITFIITIPPLIPHPSPQVDAGDEMLVCELLFNGILSGLAPEVHAPNFPAAFTIDISCLK
jgi:hypothetical protein